MTVPSVAARSAGAGPEDADGSAAGDDSGIGTGAPPQWVGGAVTVLAVVPIWVAAIRDGLRGLYPTADAAATVLRARDVFGGPFPLVGMPAAAATGDGYLTYFPGAWQLYVIAVPTELFGVVWGPALAMALLNTVWVVAACWLLHRRVQRVEALIGVAALTVLLWSLGSSFLVTPVPMDMVALPMALFLIAVWAVADGDLAAVPVLAVVANFLWLDHLVLVVTVPVVGLCAPVGLWLWVRHTRAGDPVGHPARLRRVRRSVTVAGVVTVVMWLPTLVQQFTTSPGNLGQLVASAGVDRPTVGSWPSAFHNVISVVARPAFWFRGTLESPPYLEPPIGGKLVDDLAVYDVIVGVLLVAAMVALGVAARRRGDRTGLWLLIVAGMALAMAVVTTRSAPGLYGTPTGYLRALWPTAMFVWFAVGLHVVRVVRVTRPWVVAVPSLVVIGVVTALNLPVASFGYDGDDRLQEVVATMNATVVPRFVGDEPVLVTTGIGFASQQLGAPLTLAMATAGVPYCIPSTDLASNGGKLRACPPGVRRVIEVVVTGDPDRETTGDDLVRESLLTVSDRHELSRLDRTLDDWLAGRDRAVRTDHARDRLAGWLNPAQEQEIAGLLAPGDGDLGAVRQEEAFLGLLKLWYVSLGAPTGPLFVDDPLSVTDWRRWLDLSERDQTLIVSTRTLDARSGD